VVLYAVALGLDAGVRWLFEKLPGLGVEPKVQEAVKAVQQAANWPSRLALTLMALVLAPVGEELLFRGVLYPAIKQAGYPRLALWGTAVFFAVIHVNIVLFLPLLVLALALTMIYEWTDNLLAPIVAHGVFNGLNLAVLFLAK
jgi:membrane protease YdiL (CAAX protease family)